MRRLFVRIHFSALLLLTLVSAQGCSLKFRNGLLSVLGIPAPVVTSINPVAGGIGGSTFLTLTGTGFLPGAVITIDGLTCSSVTVVSSTQATCSTPAHSAGSGYDVIFTNADLQTSTLAGAYAYNSAPAVSSVSPLFGPLAGGGTLTINGTGFVSGATLTVGGTTCTAPTFVSSTQLTCTIPLSATATLADVVVTNPSTLTGTLPSAYEYTNPPTVTGVSKSFGPTAGGQTLTITGTKFFAGIVGRINGVNCTTSTYVSATSMTCVTAAAAAGGPYAVSVLNTDSQTGSLAGLYTFVVAPTVTAVSKSFGPTAGGQTFTITGTGFFTGVIGRINGVNCATSTYVSATSMTCVTAAAAAGGPYAVSVINTDSQTGSLGAAYSFVVAPTVTSISKSFGPIAGGQTFTITGTGFFTGITGKINGVNCATSTYVSSTGMTCVTAAAAAGGPYAVSVLNTDAQTGSLASAYSFVVAPTVTSISPNYGSTAGGNTVTFTGTGFFPGIIGKINGVNCATSTYVSATSMTCVANALSYGTYGVSVLNTDTQTGSLANSYYVSQFYPGTTKTTSGAPEELAVGDFNRDGILDLATVNSGSNKVDLFLGNGDGTFQNRTSFSVASNPRGLVAGDINNDGALDLIVGAWNTGELSILVGNGAGSFAAAVTYADGKSLLNAIVDLNRDGKPDLVTTSYYGNFIRVRINDGTSSAYPALTYTDYTSNNGPIYVKTADFNRDGNPDVLVNCLNGSQVNYFQGSATGALSPKVGIATGSNPGYISVGDINNDGKLDFIVSNEGAAQVQTFLGNGNGTFGAPTAVGTSGLPLQNALEDFNGDGKLDIAVATRASDGIDVFYGNGNGTYSAKSPLTSSNNPVGLVTGDFNRDGELDYAISKNTGSGLGIFLAYASSRPATIATNNPFATLTQPTDVVSADFNRDGKLDLLVGAASNGANLLDIHLGVGDGTFGAGTTSAIGYASASSTNVTRLAKGDYNRDGSLDVAAVFSEGNTFAVAFGNGAGAFGAPANQATGTTPLSIDQGDFDLDGDLDVVVTNNGSNTVSVFLNNGSGVFAAGVTYATFTAPVGVKVTDLNRNGVPDLVVSTASGKTSVLLGNGNGTFAAKTDFNSSADAGQLLALDFNRDGKIDIGIAQGISNLFSFLAGNGAGSLAAAVTAAFTQATFELGSTDIDQDGDLDLAAVVGGTSDSLDFYLNNGSGTFTAGLSSPLGNSPHGIALGDFNADGVTDYAVGAGGANQVTVLIANP